MRSSPAYTIKAFYFAPEHAAEEPPPWRSRRLPPCSGSHREVITWRDKFLRDTRRMKAVGNSVRAMMLAMADGGARRGGYRQLRAGRTGHFHHTARQHRGVARWASEQAIRWLQDAADNGS
jgi:hypothetical protein